MKRIGVGLFVVVLSVAMLYVGMLSAEYTYVHRATLEQFVRNYVEMQAALQSCLMN